MQVRPVYTIALIVNILETLAPYIIVILLIIIAKFLHDIRQELKTITAHTKTKQTGENGGWKEWK